MKALSGGLLLLLHILFIESNAKKAWINRVPNVPAEWPAIGHTNPNDGKGLNIFGEDFATAGNRWGKELCLKDSDGDGRHNGEELGDFDCTWAVGQPKPVVLYRITNPGASDVFSDADILVFNQRRNGSTLSPTVFEETKSGTPAPLPAPGIDTQPSSMLPPWIIAHVVVGVLAIGLLSPLSFAATSILRKRVFGSSWKDAHIALSIVTLILALVSFALPFSVQELDDVDLSSVHAQIGIALMIVFLFQSKSGLFNRWCDCKCLAQSARTIRQGAGKLHQFISRVVILPLSILLLATGYDLLIDIMPDPASVVIFVQVFGSIHVLAVVLFWPAHELYQCRRRAKRNQILNVEGWCCCWNYCVAYIFKASPFTRQYKLAQQQEPGAVAGYRDSCRVLDSNNTERVVEMLIYQDKLTRPASLAGIRSPAESDSAPSIQPDNCDKEDEDEEKQILMPIVNI